MVRVPDEVLEQVEREHATGISSAHILEVFASNGIKFSEATLRKYVQLGLLPRSVRVGRKAITSGVDGRSTTQSNTTKRNATQRGSKHQGSQGLYPVRVVRQIQQIKDMMAADYTIEEIQKEFIFVRGDIEELDRTFQKVLSALREASKQRRSETSGRAVNQELKHAEELGRDLMSKLFMIEQRLTAQAELSKQAAS